MSATQCLHCLVVVVVFLVCHLQLHFFGWFGESRNFSDRTVFDLDFIMMVYWISNFGQPHVSVVKVISVLAPPSLLKSSAINFDGFSYWGCGEKEALQQSDRGIFAFLQFSLSVHVKWTSIRLENWHSAFCNLIYVIFLQDDGQPPGAQPLQPKASLFFSWLCSNIKNSCLKMAARKNVVMSSQENLLWCCDHQKKWLAGRILAHDALGWHLRFCPRHLSYFSSFLVKHLQHYMWSLK